MTQPNEVDELGAEFSNMVRRVNRGVKEALAVRRGPRGTRRDLTAGYSAEQRQQVTQLVRTAHARMRSGTHPRYARRVSDELRDRGFEDRSREQAAQAERQAEARVRDAERRAAEHEQGRSGMDGFALSAAASAAVAVATEVLLSELPQLDADADAYEAQAQESQAPDVEAATAEPVADMSVVELGHPRGIDELLTASAGSVSDAAQTAPVPEVSAEASYGLDA